ncbi:LIM/homeobox protein ceh-14-like [Dreissena polymorpha]|uniref:Homeobox domain-containing protein n=1 Tax=Dreissena polymorpha TaxID=45954 RepID=A0A9D4IKT9_DREPO|nr:LIM/homeobox protein ceh-14-like [Dreissena polymorpha]KAH3778040.1 hypothetical protein DPMN_179493 [Dreissena polymorpha]
MCKLLPGQYFYVREDARLVCSGDYQKMMHDEISDSESESDESGSDDSNASDRINIQDNQLRMFLDAYNSNKRPNKATLQYLGQSAGLKTRSVQIWFQNRRAKDRSIERNRQKIMSGQTMFNMRQNCLEEHQKSQHCWNQNPYFDSKSLGVNHKQEQKFTLASTDKGSLIRNEQSPACSDTDSSYNEYQLYCPLDYLLPNEMPPNVDLSSADICNGEVITDKLRSGNIKFGQTHAADNHSGSRSWIAL